MSFNMEHTVGTTNLDGIVMSFTQIGASHVRQEKVNQDSTNIISSMIMFLLKLLVFAQLNKNTEDLFKK